MTTSKIYMRTQNTERTSKKKSTIFLNIIKSNPFSVVRLLQRVAVNVISVCVCFRNDRQNVLNAYIFVKFGNTQQHIVCSFSCAQQCGLDARSRLYHRWGRGGKWRGSGDEYCLLVTILMFFLFPSKWMRVQTQVERVQCFDSTRILHFN